MFLCMCLHVNPDREAAGRAGGRSIHMLYLVTVPVIHQWTLIIDMPIMVGNISVQRLCACLCVFCRDLCACV